MKCPACGIDQPARFKRCFFCDEDFVPGGGRHQKTEAVVVKARQVEEEHKKKTRKTYESLKQYETQDQSRLKKRHGLPTIVGGLITMAIVLLSAGATVFLLTKSPEHNRLLSQGERELASGQYAFALKSLKQATALRPNDAHAFLVLARAYVGVDQIDKAWECIEHAQQLGLGVVAEPTLASDLANYYRQRGQYDKAIDLLRPLAQINAPGKKSELADLDALAGDDALRDGKIEAALRFWEEVNDLKEGARYPEAQARLITIYQKLADAAAANHEDAKALDYLNKLNALVETVKNHQLAATLYERQGQLESAAEQIRKALKLDDHNQALNHQLADLLNKHGKELIAAGNTQQGYAYLQQAKSIDASSSMPDVILQGLSVAVSNKTRLLTLNGTAWNPSDKTIGSLAMQVELWDADKMLWREEDKIVDEFMSPLIPQQSKSFAFTSSQPAQEGIAGKVKIYLNGTFYSAISLSGWVPNNLSNKTIEPKPTEKPKVETTTVIPPVAPQMVPNKTESTMPPPSAPPLVSKSKAPDLNVDETQPRPLGKPNGSAEEKTMKDLEF